MASEIRVNSLTNRSGLSTVSITDTGAVVAGLVTATTFSGPLTGAVNWNVTGDLTGNVTGALTGNVTGNVDGNISGQVTLEGLAPLSATSTGTAGDIRYDANYVYVCVATNTWKRTSITTW